MMAALDAIVRSGAARFVRLSSFTKQQLVECMEYGRVDAVELQLFPACERRLSSRPTVRNTVEPFRCPPIATQTPTPTPGRRSGHRPLITGQTHDGRALQVARIHLFNTVCLD